MYVYLCVCACSRVSIIFHYVHQIFYDFYNIVGELNSLLIKKKNITHEAYNLFGHPIMHANLVNKLIS